MALSVWIEAPSAIVVATGINLKYLSFEARGVFGLAVGVYG